MRIALYHNLDSGGSKREAYEFTQSLHSSGHIIDLYSPATANEDFLPVIPFINQEFRFQLELKGPVEQRLPGVRKYVDCVRLRSNLDRLDQLAQIIARQVDLARYDFAFLHHDQVVQSPFLLKYLQTSSVYYCAEPMRRFYEPGISRPQPPASKLDQLQERWYAPATSWAKQTIKRHDLENVQHADLLLTNSYFSAESIYRAYGLRARVVYLGVDEKKFHPSARSGGDYVLSVGAVAPLKGYDFLIQALGRIPTNERPRLVVVGNTASTSETCFLTVLSEQQGVRLEFLLNVDEARLVELYQNAIAFVYSPVLEPFGLAPLEAMACGTPVVAVKEGGVRESVLDGETGYLVDRVPEVFAEALLHLLQDSSQRNTLGKNGREHILSYWTWNHASQRFLDVVTTSLNVTGS